MIKSFKKIIVKKSTRFKTREISEFREFIESMKDLTEDEVTIKLLNY